MGRVPGFGYRLIQRIGTSDDKIARSDCPILRSFAFTLILIVTKMNGDLRQGGRTAVCDTCPAVSKDITQTIRAKDEIEQEGVAVCYLRKLGNLRGVWSFRRRGCR